MSDYERKEKKIYDAAGEWIGVEITEIMTREKAKELYPHLVFVDTEPICAICKRPKSEWFPGCKA